MTGFAARRRLTGAILALALQALFLALLLQSLSRPPAAAPEKLAHELTLILPRLREAPPAAAAAPAPTSKPAPLLQAPIPLVPFLPNPAAPPAAPLDMRRLGQSIFGCAPENWSSLTPEQRALCPRPGEGLAVQNAPSLLHPPKSHMKDQSTFEEEWAEQHWTPKPCPPSFDPVFCEMEQGMAEKHRAELARKAIDDQKAAALRGPPPLLPKNIGVQPP